MPVMSECEFLAVVCLSFGKEISYCRISRGDHFFCGRLLSWIFKNRCQIKLCFLSYHFLQIGKYPPLWWWDVASLWKCCVLCTTAVVMVHLCKKTVRPCLIQIACKQCRRFVSANGCFLLVSEYCSWVSGQPMKVWKCEQWFFWRDCFSNADGISGCLENAYC